MTAKAVTVTGVDGSKVYGEADPDAFTATVSGNLNNDAIVYTVSRVAGEPVGHYAVVPTGEATQGNYAVTYVTGDFEITKADTDLTVVGYNKS